MSFNNTQPPPEVQKILEALEKMKGSVLSFILPIAVALGIYTSVYKVGPEEEAVVLRLGKYVNTKGPGLHFKLPFGIDHVDKVNVKALYEEQFGFQTYSRNSRSSILSSRYKEIDRNINYEALMLTGDLNVAEVKWVVQFNISDPFKFKYQAQDPIINVRDVSESIMRRVVGDRTVTEVLTTGRVEISNQARELMQEVLDKYDIGIRIAGIKLQDVNPPKSVQASFNEVNSAKQEQEKMINEAETEYNRIIPEAKGKAKKLISEAQGYAKAIINRAEGDADKFKAIAREYRKAPAITKKRIYLETMENIFSRMENVTIVDDKVKGLLPVFGGGLREK
ncbi:MAG: FtsH protease activity modulator HflK [Halobacteriovoraceae bacterium]|nr:FtsH protease activity modulator HflK [Halobacteriovoraceae bacterium]|tara:strand:- start:11189 stop:12199 length:1011 start_codon:yes stop_codon:yes gene_type:complete